MFLSNLLIVKTVFPQGTGVIITDRTLDRETVPVYNLTVKAQDVQLGADNKSSLSATTSVVVYILDENDDVPIFNQSMYTFHVLENAAKLHVVGSVIATDEDAGPNGMVTYHIFVGNSRDR